MPVTLIKSRWSSGDLLFEDISGNGVLSLGNGPKLSFFGATLASRPSAYTQTYATADKTHAGRTATAVATADLVDDGGAYNAAWADTVVTMCNELKADLNALRNDHLDTAQIVNAIIDDLQTYGLFQ
jgi:hypothetical protein